MKGDQNNKYRRLSKEELYEDAITFFKNYRQLSQQPNSKTQEPETNSKSSTSTYSSSSLQYALPELCITINKLQKQLDKFDGLESLKEEINKLFEFSKTDSQKQEVLSKMEDMSEQLKVHSKMLQSLLDDQESGMSKTNQV
ncbi:hypothetical protein EB796_018508 [Bugula neritina]|uniref:Uncharacterized protein n=1 Tax=Bugula neritina TaxID=10212 RepID=A0A7J7JAW4_BUGNE|nr:hypothetical protein EB796_018508 [Bugula neritina]